MNVDTFNYKYYEFPDSFKLAFRGISLTAFGKCYDSQTEVLKNKDKMFKKIIDPEKKQKAIDSEVKIRLSMSLRIALCSMINRIFDVSKCQIKINLF